MCNKNTKYPVECLQMLIVIVIAEKILGLHKIPSEFRNQASEIMNRKSDFRNKNLYFQNKKTYIFHKSNQISELPIQEP